MLETFARQTPKTGVSRNADYRGCETCEYPIGSIVGEVNPLRLSSQWTNSGGRTICPGVLGRSLCVDPVAAVPRLGFILDGAPMAQR